MQTSIPRKAVDWPERWQQDLLDTGQYSVDRQSTDEIDQLLAEARVTFDFDRRVDIPGAKIVKLGGIVRPLHDVRLVHDAIRSEVWQADLDDTWRGHDPMADVSER